MKTSALLTLLVLAVGAAEASSNHRLGISRISNAHHGRNIARNEAASELTRRADGSRKRCKPANWAVEEPSPNPSVMSSVAVPSPFTDGLVLNGGGNGGGGGSSNGA